MKGGTGMCCSSQVISCSENSGRWRKKTRLAALLACVFFIAVSLLLIIFILTHADHTHDQDGPGGTCAACACVMAAGNLLKILGSALVAAALYFGGRHTVIFLSKHIASDLGFLTLVSLKIRLNN